MRVYRTEREVSANSDQTDSLLAAEAQLSRASLASSAKALRSRNSMIRVMIPNAYPALFSCRNLRTL